MIVSLRSKKLSLIPFSKLSLQENAQGTVLAKVGTGALLIMQTL